MKPVVASTAYLLISHGSRDMRPQEAMNRLADLVRKQLEAEFQPSVAGDVATTSHRVSIDRRDHDRRDQHSLFDGESAPAQGYTEAYTDRERGNSLSSGDSLSDRNFLVEAAEPSALLTRPRLEIAQPVSSKVIVGTACLELSPLPLSEQIYEFGQRLIAVGVRELKLLPVFLMSGVHVMEDIPEEVATAKAQLKGAIELTLCPHLGSHAKITAVLAERLAAVPASEGSLLIAHGSRRPKGNKAIAQLAKTLDTAVAYWAVPPDIETQVIELMQKGAQRLTILPYFLFAGGITDAIAHRTEELAERFPKVSFRLLPTLGATDEIARLAIELTTELTAELTTDLTAQQRLEQS